MNKTQRLQLRVTQDLKEKLETLAASENRTVSNYIENLIIGEWNKKYCYDVSLDQLDRIEQFVKGKYDNTIPVEENAVNLLSEWQNKE